MSYRLTDRLPDYNLEPPDDPKWCEGCDEPLNECGHSEPDPDAAYENKRDLQLED